MTDKDRSDEKLFNYVFINQQNRIGFPDTKIGGDLLVSKNVTTDTLKVSKIGYAKDGTDASGSGMFKDLSSNTLNVFGNAHIYGNLLVDTIVKKTVTEVDIDIRSNLELINDLGVGGIFTSKNGLDMSGLGTNNKINNVVIGNDVSNSGRFTHITSSSFDTLNFNVNNLGYDTSGRALFTELSTQELNIFSSLTIGTNESNTYLTSKGSVPIKITTNDNFLIERQPI